MIDEKKRLEIEKQAEDILRKFSESLKNVKIGAKKEGKKEVGGFRKEGVWNQGSKPPQKEFDEDFRRRMFNNAPNKEGDAIVAEKKSW